MSPKIDGKDGNRPQLRRFVSRSLGCVAGATFANKIRKNQYERKLRDDWGFRKNLTSKEWEYVLRETYKRENKRKDSQVKLNGVTIRKEKIKKQKGRYSLSGLNRIYNSREFFLNKAL
jgi:hypothetical protein